MGLVEFQNPTTSFRDRPVSETDQRNGITERFCLTLNADQVRYWDGHWSEWHQGAGHSAATGIVNARMGVLMGEWMTILEKRNGEWCQADVTAIRDLVQDPALLG